MDWFQRIWSREWRVPVACLGVAMAVGFCGCASKGNSSATANRLNVPSGGSGTIEQLHLLVTAVAVDLDQKPGPDGFGARVYASSRGIAEATPITRGRLEIAMYDGAIKPDEMSAKKPLRTWVFDPKKLRALAQFTSIGAGYRFALAWGENKPAQNKITIVARHISENGAEVVSAPGIVPLSVK